MDTDEGGEVPLEPEGTAVDMQKSCGYLKMQYIIHIRWGYTLECDRALRKKKKVGDIFCLKNFVI